MSTTGGSLAIGTFYVVLQYFDSSGLPTALSPYTAVTTYTATSTITVTPPPQNGNSGWMYYATQMMSSPAERGGYLSMNAVSTDFSTLITFTTLGQSAYLLQPRGTDYSTQNTAQLTLSDIVTTATSARITSATGGFTSAMVGNIIQIQGSSDAGFYEVLCVDSSNSIVLDRVLTTTAAEVSGSVGGAISLYSASLTQTSGTSNGHKIYIKSGSYNLPSSGNGATGFTFANPSCSPSAGLTNQALRISGYSTNRGDNGFVGSTDYRPVITLASTATPSSTVFKFTNGGVYIDSLIIDCNGATSSTGIRYPGSYCKVENCLIRNFTVAGLDYTGSSNSLVVNTEITAGVSGATAAVLATSPVTLHYAYIHSNTCIGIKTSGIYCFSSIIANNTGTTSDGIYSSSNAQLILLDNIIHNNGQYGINDTAAINYGHLIRNNIISNNVKQGLNIGSSPGICQGYYADGNAYYYNNSSLVYSGQITYIDNGNNMQVGQFVPNDKNLTVSPYTNASINNFTLNSTANGGAACHSTCVPLTIPGLSSELVGMDIGLYRSSSSSSGGMTGVSISRLIGGV